MQNTRTVQLLRYNRIALFSFVMLLSLGRSNAQTGKTIVRFDKNKTHQTIRNFSASDAWACQFVGNWPDEKRNQVADWLFSVDTNANGSPKGIGLTMWRYNLGAGSAEQGDSSKIRDPWRRAALFDATDEEGRRRVEAQNWFLQAAGKRGVKQFLAFYNSPPVQLTKTKKAFAFKAQSNIDSLQYDAFAAHAVKAIQSIKKTTGIAFDFISPVNEPQWDWSDGGQEGSPYSNRQVYGVVKSFSNAFQRQKLATKILITESGHIQYLLPGSDKPGKDNQIADFFASSSSDYVGNLPSVSRTIASHSYFSTSPFDKGIAIRNKVREQIEKTGKLEYWQSEYCILGDNAGDIDGNKRDLGMNAALYVAKVIYQDLVAANASAWQWWLAVSAYDYKDGLVYVDKNKTDGNVCDSKMMWAMGNYSRFVRPGMRRIDVDAPEKKLLVSAYKSENNKTTVLVFVNPTDSSSNIALESTSGQPGKLVSVYTTDATRNLEKSTTAINDVIIPSKSVVTVIVNDGK